MKPLTLYLLATLAFAGLASRPASAFPCGVVTPCPTNFAEVTGLNTTPRMIAAGGSSVWALDANYAIYRWNPATKVFNQIPGSLVWIVVGGGDVRQPDEVWGYNANGQYWRWNWSLNNWTFIPIPSAGLSGLKIGKGYHGQCFPYEVWGLGTPTTAQPNNVYRYNFCSSSWVLVAGQLASLSIGGGEVWGINRSSQIFRFNSATQSGWTQIAGTLTSLAVGPDGIWGINASQQVFQFNPATHAFVQIPNASLIAIYAGGNGVWGLNSSYQVFRYQAISRTFAPSPSVNLSWLSVGSGGDVWGIDTTQHIRAFVTPAVSPSQVLTP